MIDPRAELGAVHRAQTLGSAIVAALTFAAFMPGAALAVEITQVPRMNVSGRQLTIWWRTDLPASSQVAWGSASAPRFQDYPRATGSTDTQTTLHSCTIRRPPFGTLYFRVRSADGTSAAESTEQRVEITAEDSFPLGDLSFNGPVLAIGSVGTTWYLGGTFTSVGPSSGSFVLTDSERGTLLSSHFPEVSGEVYTIVSDGSGGWFIGGRFETVGGLQRNNIAHLLPDRGIDPYWIANSNGPVYSLKMGSGVLYVGGDFGMVNNQSRGCLAALNPTTALLLPWNPRTSRVFEMAVAGDAVYVVDGTMTYSFDAASGATRLAVRVNFGYAYDIAVSGSTVFIAGDFTTIFGLVPTAGVSLGRGGFAAFDAITAQVLPFNPEFNGLVRDFVVVGNTIYAAGDFTRVNGSGGPLRNGFAAIDAVTGTASDWNPPAVGGPVESLVVVGNVAYAVGTFKNVFSAGGPLTRGNGVAFELPSGAVTPWNPNLDSSVWDVSSSAGTIALGGAFSSANSQPRRFAAAIDSRGGVLLPWAPDPDGPVFDLAPVGDTVYLAGDFATVGGVARSALAAVDGSTSELGSLRLPFNGPVRAMKAAGGTMFVAGDFTVVGSGGSARTRNRAAAFDLSTGALTAWNPDVSDRVNAIDVRDQTVYLGGQFHTVQGNARQFIAAVDSDAGVPTAFIATPGHPLFSVKSSPFGLLVGGQFDRAFALLNQTTGQVLPWSVQGFKWGNGLALAGEDFVVGGVGVGPQLAVLSAVDATRRPWTYALFSSSGVPDPSVYSLHLDCERGVIGAGGDFMAVGGGAPRRGFALLPAPNCPNFDFAKLITEPEPPGQGQSQGQPEEQPVDSGAPGEATWRVGCGCSTGTASWLGAVFLVGVITRRRRGIVLRD
jgi:hypothetical protein